MSLSPEEIEILKHILIEDEGLELMPYLDCCGKYWRLCVCKAKGKLTIGVGRNLDDLGISENEALGLELNDIKRCSIEVERAFPWFSKLNPARRVVIMCMAFNLGVPKLKQFQKMIKQIESGDFRSASIEMLNSNWASQVKARATRLSLIMEKGKF